MCFINEAAQSRVKGDVLWFVETAESWMDYFIEMRIFSLVVLFFQSNVLIISDWQKKQALQDNETAWWMSFSPRIYSILEDFPGEKNPYFWLANELDGETLISVETVHCSACNCQAFVSGFQSWWFLMNFSCKKIQICETAWFVISLRMSV